MKERLAMNRHLCTASLVFSMLAAVTTVRGDSSVEPHQIQTKGQAFAIEPCLGGEGSWDYESVGTFQIVRREGPMQVRVQANLRFNFRPTDPTLPTYEGHEVLNDAVLPSSQQGGQTLFEFPVIMQMHGSDGSSVTMTGIIFRVVVVEGSGAGFSLDPVELDCN